MEEHQIRLAEAARLGDINLLHEIIRRNRGVLRQIDETPFLDTPLHVAASEGQVPFAMEMMRLIPSYARKSNADGFSPVHTAVLRGQTKAAAQLTKRGAELIRQSGRESFTPLHCAAQTGNVELLGTFLAASPESMADVTVRGETALTVALKNEKVEAFEFLVAWIFLGYDQTRRWKKNIVSFEDDDGQTVAQRYRNISSYKPEVLGFLESVTGEDWSHLQILIERPGNISSPFSFIDPFVRHLRADQKLMLAAYKGDVNGLFSSSCDDPDLLERIDKVQFMDTPLHIAASTGNTPFALEMMRLKPTFARKMNQEGYSPLHLAVKNSRFDTMLRLVDVDNELVRVKGKDGKTPLHCLVEKGTSRARHIARLLAACPLSITDLTDRKETALHLAGRLDRIEALEVLLGLLLRVDEMEILTWADDEGKDFWSIVKARNNDMVRKWLSVFMPWSIEIDTYDRPRDVNNYAARATSSYGGLSVTECLRSRVSWMGKVAFGFTRMKLCIKDGARDAFIVVLALIATVTFQAVVSPPGGVWQADPTLRFPDGSNNSEADGAAALSLVGQAVMDDFPRTLFLIFNTLAFIHSASLICVFLPDGGRGSVIVVLLMVCYMISSYVIGYRSLGWWVFIIGCMVYCTFHNYLTLFFLKKLDKAFHALSLHRFYLKDQ